MGLSATFMVKSRLLVNWLFVTNKVLIEIKQINILKKINIKYKKKCYSRPPIDGATRLLKHANTVCSRSVSVPVCS